MWTHLQPYLNDDFTADSIARHARVGLWRSINLKRLIGFTGSGISLAHGFPTWTETAALFIAATKNQLEQAYRGSQLASYDCEALILQINRLSQSDFNKKNDQYILHPAPVDCNYGEIAQTLMDLCEELLKKLPEPDAGGSHLELARASFAAGFLDGDERNCKSKLGNLFDPEERLRFAQIGSPKMVPLWEIGEDEDLLLSSIRAALEESSATEAMESVVTNIGTLERRTAARRQNASCPDFNKENREKLAGSYFYNSAKNVSGDVIGPDKDTGRDPFNAILGELGIRRVLTLNYDVQLERWISDKQRIPRIGNGRGFNDLCAPAVDGDRTSPKKSARIEVKSGVSRTAVSVSLNRDNIGDLINFGAYSGAFEHQIFHLHGRADLAEQIVVTENDYRQVYIQEELSQQAFEAAQEVVFGGNDVLFMGVGMSEEDVLRPFRRFVSRGRANNHLPRRTFALMPSATGENWRETNDKRAVNSAIRYDVYTLFYGGLKFRAASQMLKKLKGFARKTSVDTEIVDENLTPQQRKDKRAAAVEKQTENQTRALTDIADARTALGSDGTELLKESERKLIDLTTNLPTPLSAFQVRLITLLGNELLTRVKSRALVRELNDLKEGAREWWSVWRDAPHERKARFHIAEKEHAGEINYLWTRHRNNLGVIDVDEDARQLAMAEIKKAVRLELAATQSGSTNADPETPSSVIEEQLKATNEGNGPSGRRIVRMTAPRGGGKGTLVGLLHNKDLQQEVFASNVADGGMVSKPTYEASFLAHLSFSMEFNSVIKSLTRFLARHVATLQVDSKNREKDMVLRTINKELQSTAKPGSERTRRLRELTRLTSWYGKDGSPEDSIDLDTIAKLKASLISCRAAEPTGLADSLNRIARALFIHRCEDEPRLISSLNDKNLNEWLEASYVWTKEMLNKSTPREHRLDQLRYIMQQLQDATEGTNKRYFICLGGLDRLADKNGDGYNPSHRAFFRLLTGRENRHDSDKLNPPFDLVLVAGRPDAPICYLSDDFGFSKEDNEEWKNIQTGDLQKFAWKSNSKRLIRKWYEFGPFGWDARVSFLGSTKSKLNNVEIDALKSISKALKDTDSATLSRPPEDRHGAERAHRLLWQNLCLSHWAMTYWAVVGSEKYNLVQAGLTTDEEQENAAKRYLNELDGAVARGGVEGVLNFLLDNYDRDERKRNRRQADLVQHVLRHLVLFALPVEPWVLMGCPMIYAQLLELYKEQFDTACSAYNKKKPKAQRYVPGRGNAERALLNWHERAWMLGQLERTLGRVLKRGLVLEIYPASHKYGQENSRDPDAFLHRRYSLHGIMREHLSNRMQLPVIDGGDLNHHRMSVYCDQPRDLPTPSHEHFQLIDRVLENLIRRSRETLRAVIQCSVVSKRYASPSWDPEKDEEDKGPSSATSRAAARRFFAPVTGDLAELSTDSDEVKDQKKQCNILKKVLAEFKDDILEGWDNQGGRSGGLGSLHAVPQRLRACLSLIQGTFSIGALSRLDGVEASDGDTTPYDAYGAWLRSLTNAGTSLGRSRREINDTLEDLTFKDNGVGNSDYVNASQDPDRKEFETMVQSKLNEIGFANKQVSSFKKIRHPYYRDEIAWLYNERGLTNLAQGNIFDALPLFEQASFVMSHHRTPNEDVHAFHAAERRIRLNYAIAKIEQGNLAHAREILEDLKVTSAHVDGSTPSQTAGLAELYLSVCNHLTGGHQLAISGYVASISNFVENKQLRAVAIANRHYADILAATGDTAGALQQVDLAISASSQAEQRDVLYFSTISKARILIEENRQDEGQDFLRKAIEYAETMGLQSLLIDAKLAHSKLLIKRGDHSLAGQKAAEAISIAVRNGLELRKIGAVVELARAKMYQRHTEFASSLLKEAKTHAESLGYLTQAARATRYLTALD